MAGASLFVLFYLDDIVRSCDRPGDYVGELRGSYFRLYTDPLVCGCFGHLIFLSETGIKKQKTNGYMIFVLKYKKLN